MITETSEYPNLERRAIYQSFAFRQAMCVYREGAKLHCSPLAELPDGAELLFHTGEPQCS